MTTGPGPGPAGRVRNPPAHARTEFRVDDNQCTLCNSCLMTSFFDWSTAKNRQLLDQRGISFERVVSAVEQGGLLDVLQHPNQDRYPGQSIYVVDIEKYICLVPFVMKRDGTRFLKTIIPSRKATRDYLERKPS